MRPLIDALHNVVTNSWGLNITKEELPSEGKEFRKMRLHGHFIRCGEANTTPWFARIVRFLSFHSVKKGTQSLDVAEVRWYETANRVLLPANLREVYKSLI